MVPEFKHFISLNGEVSKAMSDLHYESVAEIKESILWGGEVCFVYQGRSYGIFRTEQNILLSCGEKGVNGEWSFTDPDALLNHTLNGEHLKDVLLKAKITWRNI
ncbi:MAG: hypothetical protein IJ236_01385 [Oscillospiraceae bacterium]|nr:hypothetical protein [Oscillospiraceae bacterium]